MERSNFYKFLLVIAGIEVIGVMIMFMMLGSSDYYREQQYNNLPSLNEDKPAPIEHYEEARDESVAATEEHITEMNTNGSEQGFAAPHGGLLVGGNQTGLFSFKEEDGSLDILMIGMVAGLFAYLGSGFSGFSFIRALVNMMIIAVSISLGISGILVIAVLVFIHFTGRRHWAF